MVTVKIIQIKLNKKKERKLPRSRNKLSAECLQQTQFQISLRLWPLCANTNMEPLWRPLEVTAPSCPWHRSGPGKLRHTTSCRCEREGRLAANHPDCVLPSMSRRRGPSAHSLCVGMGTGEAGPALCAPAAGLQLSVCIRCSGVSAPHTEFRAVSARSHSL